MQQWMERAPNVHLHLPAPNVFIPTDLSLKSVAKKVQLVLNHTICKLLGPVCLTGPIVVKGYTIP